VTDGELKSIEVEGYASIRSARVDLGRLNILIGANGAGKSNFIRVFELLGRPVEEDLGYFVGLNGGASALVTSGADRLRIVLDGTLGRYVVELVPESNDELIFMAERLSGDGFVVLPRGARETDLYGGCRGYHFHDTSRSAPVKQLVPTADNLALRSDAGDLAAVLLALSDSDDQADRAAYRRIVGVTRQVAPFFGRHPAFHLPRDSSPPPAVARTGGVGRAGTRFAPLRRRPVGGTVAAGVDTQPGARRHPVGHPDEPVRA
jgi:predicted ATPase